MWNPSWKVGLHRAHLYALIHVVFVRHGWRYPMNDAGKLGPSYKIVEVKRGVPLFRYRETKLVKES